jgi:hypothetical protein
MALIKALQILMSGTTFKFGDTYWTQESGTAMGSPAAPMYATLYFAIHELDIIPKFPNLRLYGRYIDDAFGVWTPEVQLNDIENGSQSDKYQELQSQFDAFGKLRWQFTPLLKSVDFLDITIKLDQGRICSLPFEKHLNLYLYIPPTSAHPPGNLQNLIYGRIIHLKRITSCRTQLKCYMSKLKKRLIARGYLSTAVTKAFNRALSMTTDSNCKQNGNTTTSIDNPVFLHNMYHPKGVPAHMIQTILRTSLLNPKNKTPFGNLYSKQKFKVNVTKVLIANHRPANLAHYLTSRKFRSTTSSVAMAVAALTQPNPTLTQPNPTLIHPKQTPTSIEARDTSTLPTHTKLLSNKHVILNPYHKKRNIRDCQPPECNKHSGNNPTHPHDLSGNNLQVTNPYKRS